MGERKQANHTWPQNSDFKCILLILFVTPAVLLYLTVHPGRQGASKEAGRKCKKPQELQPRELHSLLANTADVAADIT